MHCQIILGRHAGDKMAETSRSHGDEPCHFLSHPAPPQALHPITLDYGADDPLVLESRGDAPPAAFEPPRGVEGLAARRLTSEALVAEGHCPPLAAHVVPGDRVVVALAGDIPQGEQVIAAIVESLSTAGVDPGEVSLVQAPRLGFEAGCAGGGTAMLVGTIPFDPAIDAGTAYLAADEAGVPLYLARHLVDADVVVAVGDWGWDAALGGRSIEGELWPTFSRAGARSDLLVALARRGRGALGDWKSTAHDITWQLGVCASLRLVRGAGGTLYAACFGLPDEASRRARLAAAAWSPSFAATADVAIASLSNPVADFGPITAALAAAARVTRPGGTICIAGQTSVAPGIIFQRWRQGVPLEGLVHEAVASGDAALIADALQTRLFARALDDRRLVLLSNLDEATVEELEFGFAATPEVVERLAYRAESLAVLPEADRCFPRHA